MWITISIDATKKMFDTIDTDQKKKFARIYREIEICPFRGVNLLLVYTVYRFGDGNQTSLLFEVC